MQKKQKQNPHAKASSSFQTDQVRTVHGQTYARASSNQPVYKSQIAAVLNTRKNGIYVNNERVLYLFLRKTQQ